MRKTKIAKKKTKQFTILLSDANKPKETRVKQVSKF